jgi:hypothetical protein
LSDILDKAQMLAESISSSGIFETNGWRIIKRASTAYQLNRSVYECLAIKLKNNSPTELSTSK